MTEKLLEPLAAGSIPIYWGASESRTDFNPATFVDARQFADFGSLAEYLLRLDSDDSALAKLAEAPIFPTGIPYQMCPSYFVDRIELALDSPHLHGPISSELDMMFQEEKLRRRLRLRYRQALNLLGL